MDIDRNNKLYLREIVAFFQKSKAAEGFRKIAVRHVSEWGDRNDAFYGWENSLNRAPDFGATKAGKHQMFVNQIEPFLWWGDNVSAAVGLPADKVVWGYHPITFVLWLHERLQGTPQAAKAIQSEAAWNGKKPPAHILDDAEATDGFMDDEDALFGEAAKSLDLEKLAGGYPE